MLFSVLHWSLNFINLHFLQSLKKGLNFKPKLLNMHVQILVHLLGNMKKVKKLLVQFLIVNNFFILLFHRNSNNDGNVNVYTTRH